VTGKTRTAIDPSVVLGLCAYTHDSAAALLVGGELVGFAEEERLTGEKHTKAFPALAVDWLLAEAGLQPGQVTAVGYNFQPDGYRSVTAQLPGQFTNSATRKRALPRARSFAMVAQRTEARLRRIEQLFPNAPVTPVLHHETHGLYAFASSAYEEAGVLVVDSLGEKQTTTIAAACRAAGAESPYKIVEAIDDPASLGYAYGAVTEHLGWRRGDEEGTVMALAALGDPARFRELLARAIPLTDTGFALDATLFPLRVLSSRFARISPAFRTATCPPRRPAEEVTEIHADLAAALQERTEQIMLHLARRVRRITGSARLCLGGGVATNCLAAGLIAQSGLFDEVHVPPAPGDAGTAIGAALAVHLEATGVLPDHVAEGCYLGPAYPSVDLDAQPPSGLRAHRVDDPARFLARSLADGAIVGLFQGRLEAGPRALGNRSILASPLLPDVVTRLNSAVKFREPFRPFAPVVLAEQAAKYFTLPQASPYMSFASPVTELARATIPAVVHANGTARVQTLDDDANPFLARVLAEFAALTGVPVLINTSLNVKGQPIAGTPKAALDTLILSGLDALMLEGWWVTK
jgi:carbamoyltransferase